MNPNHALRLTGAAALTALTAFGAQAVEATQWNASDDNAMVTASHDPTWVPTAWVVSSGEATQFHDMVSADTMLSRASVRDELAESRAHGLMNDTGEAGATEQVLAQRRAFNQAEYDRLAALNLPAEQSSDPIADIAAMTTPSPGTDDSLIAQGPNTLDPFAGMPDS